ncbi:MAG: hypothetical protein E6J54_31075 [Deltaproteobacteria bacterium]|nr:MAG: hypothetical protein E6J54_31075 [Deltaproteobacteria bacterium]
MMASAVKPNTSFRRSIRPPPRIRLADTDRSGQEKDSRPVFFFLEIKNHQSASAFLVLPSLARPEIAVATQRDEKLRRQIVIKNPLNWPAGLNFKLLTESNLAVNRAGFRGDGKHRATIGAFRSLPYSQ